MAVAVAVAVGAALLTTPASGLNTNRTGPGDGRGFPTYYTDDTGMSLQMCEDGSAACLGASPANLVPPDGESFYWMATATIPSSRGPLDVEFALEAAFAGNRPIVFDRLRVRGHLSRAGKYTLLHPYGSTRVRAISPIEQRNVNFTADLGCSVARRGPCRGHITSFMQSSSSRLGFIGGPSPRGIRSGLERDDLVLLSPTGKVIGRTRKFAILGKVAPGPAAALSAPAVDFGNRRLSAQKTVTVRNIGDAALNLSRISLVGATTFRLIRAGTCRTRGVMAPGRSCTVVVGYTPTARRKTPGGALVIADNTIAGSHRLRIDAMTAAVVSTRRRLHFKARTVGTESRTRRILIDNTGVLPLTIRGVSVRGGAARSFARRSGQGPECGPGVTVQPRRTCALYVAFTPKTFGVKKSGLVIRSNAAGGATRVRLSGRGR